MRKLFTTILAAILLGLFCTSAYCHKIRVFAYSEGDTIIGEASLSGGKKARETSIIVTDKASGRQLLTTKTDSSGQFAFPVPEEARNSRMALLIIADAGEGHRNHWLLEAADYLPDAENTSTTVNPDAGKSTPPPVAQVLTPPTASFDEERLRRIIEESVASQLGPIKRQLAEASEKRITLQDILGGLGYIIGLAGTAAFIKSQKGDRHES